MSPKQLVVGTLVSALTLSATGYVIFGIAFPEFFTNFMNAGSATNVERQQPLLWAVAVAMLSYGLLVTLAVWHQQRRELEGDGYRPAARNGSRRNCRRRHRRRTRTIR